MHRAGWIGFGLMAALVGTSASRVLRQYLWNTWQVGEWSADMDLDCGGRMDGWPSALPRSTVQLQTHTPTLPVRCSHAHSTHADHSAAAASHRLHPCCPQVLHWAFLLAVVFVVTLHSATTVLFGAAAWALDLLLRWWYQAGEWCGLWELQGCGGPRPRGVGVGARGAHERLQGVCDI